MKKRTRLEINLNQFRQNIDLIKSYIGRKTKYCLPLKADAYGHGIYKIADIAKEKCLDYLAIARIEEGLLLREKNIQLPIILLGIFFLDDVDLLIKYDIEPTISSYQQAEKLVSISIKKRKIINVHLKLDTGMNRIGAKLDEADLIYNLLIANKYIKIKSIYSHFACSDEKNKKCNHLQRDIFNNFIQKKDKTILKHMANSAALINFEDIFFDMVRPGILSYGYFPENIKQIPSLLQKISPIMSLRSKVGLIKKLEKGEKVSYSHTYIAKKDTYIAIIPIGYGDGYKYLFSKDGFVIINDKKYPILGKICMDLIIVDIFFDEISLNDDVILMGKSESHEISAQHLSKKINSHVYELLCGFTQRVPLVYY